MNKKRLDQYLFEKNPSECQKQILGLIMSGAVKVNDRRIDKAGYLIQEDDQVDISWPARFVSRGGEKLAGAIDHFQKINLQNKVALDIGLSTGGFTDCLLHYGINHVFGVDVAYGKVSEKLRMHQQCSIIERQNARHLNKEVLKILLKKSNPNIISKVEEISVVVMDVSFISILKILPAIKEISNRNSDYLCLIKPQFEAPKEWIEPGGVIQNPMHIESVLDTIKTACVNLGFKIKGIVPSSIKGKKSKNQEYMLWMQQ